MNLQSRSKAAGAVAVCLGLLAFLPAARAQYTPAEDTLRLLTPIVPSAATPSGFDLQDAPYTMAIDKLKLLASVHFETEWNDNIILASTGQEQDFILRPVLNLQGVLPFTEMNALRFNVGAGYEAYVEHPGFSRFLLTPGSALSFEAKTGDWHFNVHDQVSYDNDPTVYGNINGIVRLGGLFNTAGLGATMDLDTFVLSFGYDHLNFISSLAAFNTLNSSSDVGTAKMSLRVHPAVRLGVEGGGGVTDYSEDALSNFKTYTAGGFALCQLAPMFKVGAHAGWVGHQFDTPALAGGHSSIPGYYLTLTADRQLTRAISVGLGGGHDVAMSINGELLQSWYVQMAATWEIMRHTLLNLSLRYDAVTQPYADSVDQGLAFSSHYDRVALTIGVSRVLARNIEASLKYRLLITDGQTQFASYEQNAIIVGVSYRF